MARPYIVVVMLAIASAMANAGGALLSACLPLLKSEFGFSDSQLGLLTGYASALTVALLAFPITSAARRWGNSKVLGLSLIVYSGAIATTAACSSFFQLVAARLMSGLGPAAEFPLCQAITSDYFPPEKRSGALSIYTLGFFGGVTGGLVAGGWLAANYGWRNAFLIFAVTGVVVAILQMLIAPDRGDQHRKLDVAPVETIYNGGGLRELFRNRIYFHLMLGFGWASFATMGLIQWMPSFYNRQFGLAPAEASAIFGGVYAAGALCGVLLGGVLGDKLGGASPEKLLKFCILVLLLTFPLISIVLFAPNLHVAMVVHVLSTFVGSMPNGPLMALVQNELPREQRVLGSSFFLLTMTLLGAGGGPLIIGVASDMLNAALGDGSLRWSMLGVKLLGFLAFVHFFIAWRVISSRSKLANG